MSGSTAAVAAGASSPSSSRALPYPNVLQARHTSEEHRSTAADAVMRYQANLANEQARHTQDDVVLSEEETARLQKRVNMQTTANASAAQMRQRAADVVTSVEGSDDADATGQEVGAIGVYHAACDGDVGALAGWIARVQPPSSLPARINAPGQPDPATYNGVQFQQRWLFQAPPLIFAAAFGREDAVRFLLDNGADPQVRSSTGLRAVDYAEQRGYAAIASLLRGGQ